MYISSFIMYFTVEFQMPELNRRTWDQDWWQGIDKHLITRD